MSETPHPTRSAAALATVALAAFAATLALRLIGIDTTHVSLDEVYTQFAISRDWWGMVDDRAARGHMPLYFGLAKLSGIDVENVVALRRFTAASDAVAAAILAAGVARFAGLRAGIWLAAFYATAPALVHWGQNARPYGLLMIFVAIGLVGAMALADSVRHRQAGRGDTQGGGSGTEPGPWRAADRAFAIGWIGACLTLTGGIFAYVAVVLFPRVRRGIFRESPFRERWRRAAVPATITAIVAYLAVSRPHVFEGGVGGFWVEENRPFGLTGLWELTADMIAGRLREAAALPLPSGGEPLAIALMATGFVALAVLAARHAGAHPAFWPLIALAVGFPAILLSASIVTSLLVDRYFLPGWAGLLALAAIGLSHLRMPVQALVGLPLLAASFWYALATATAPTTRDGALPAELAALIEATPQRQVTILTDDVFLNLRREILSLRLNDPAERRPLLRRARPERVSDMLAAGSPFFIAIDRAQWDSQIAPLLGASPCMTEVRTYVVALAASAECPPPLARLPGQ